MADILTASELTHRLVPSHVPRSEESRGIWGSQANMDHIENALTNARAGYMTDLADLGREVLDLDPHMSGVCSKRFGALQACGYDVTAPANVDKRDQKWADEIATKTAQILDQLSLAERIKDLGWACFDGRGAQEIIWQAGAHGLPVAPVALQWIHPRRLSFDRSRRLHVTSAWAQRGFEKDEQTAIDSHPGKFVSWLPRLFNEYPEREGLCPRLIYWGYFKRFSWRMRMKLMELFGIPWRVVHLDAPNGTTLQPEAIAQAHAEATRLGGEAVGVFQKGMEVSVEYPPERSGELFSKTAQEIDNQVSKLVLGNTGTADLEANRASSVVGKGEQDLIWMNDGVGVSTRFSLDLARPIARMGWGPNAERLAATITVRAFPARDQKAELERITQTLTFGVSVPESLIREASGLRAPAPGESYVVMGAGGTDAMGNATPGAFVVVDPNKGGSAGGGPALPPAGDDDDEDLEPGDEGTLEGDGVDGAAAAALRDVLGLQRLMAAIPMTGTGATPAEERKVVPASAVYGSAEPLIERASREGARAAERWTETMLAACDGVSSAPGLHRALAQASKSIEQDQLEGFARALERRLVHALALGALDADWEAENDKVVRPPAFSVDAERYGEEVFALGGGVVDFVTKPFAWAIRFFKSKKVLPKRQFDRLTAQAKRHAFTAAGLTNTRMLQTAHEELTRALTDGADLRTFRGQLSSRFELAGWTAANPSHIENVFRTNIMGAYSGGRDVQMRQPHVLAARPFWQVLGVKDARTRETHRAALGKVLRADDKFWSAASPPFGFQCRCRRVSRSAEAVARLGLEVVEGSSLRDLPDVGFDAGSLFG